MCIRDRLEGVVISLVAQSSLNRRTIDMKLVKDVVRQFVSHVDREVSVDNIKILVAKHFDCLLYTSRCV